MKFTENKQHYFGTNMGESSMDIGSKIKSLRLKNGSVL